MYIIYIKNIKIIILLAFKVKSTSYIYIYILIWIYSSSSMFDFLNIIINLQFIVLDINYKEIYYSDDYILLIIKILGLYI